MAVLSFREATEITFEQQRADNLHLRAQVDALKADLAQLREMYQDRDGDLAFEFERANRLEAQNERLGAENERLTDAWLQYEHIQPNGELGASVGDVLTENELLRGDNDRLRDTIKHLTPGYTAAVNSNPGIEFERAYRLQDEAATLRDEIERLTNEVERLTELANAQAATDTAMLDDVEPMLKQAMVLAEMRTAEVERLTSELAAVRFAYNAELPGPCSAQGGCDCPADSDEDTPSPGGYKAARGVLHRGHDAEPPEDVIRRLRDEDTAWDGYTEDMGPEEVVWSAPGDEDAGCSPAMANELAIVRSVYAKCTHEHTLEPTDGKRNGTFRAVYTIRVHTHEHVLREKS